MAIGVPMVHLWGTPGVAIGVPMASFWRIYGVPFAYSWRNFRVPLAWLVVYLWRTYGALLAYPWRTFKKGNCDDQVGQRSNVMLRISDFSLNRLNYNESKSMLKIKE